MSDRTTEDGSDGSAGSLPGRLTEWYRQTFGSEDDGGGTKASDSDRTGPADESERGSTDGNAGPASDDEERDLLLTDEERVLRELQGSGRLKQTELVERMDWSKGKVSRLLSRMEEADQVCRTQIGREKIVALPEQQFEAAKSITDDEDSELVYR